MSRSQPYRGKIPTHIIQLMDVASRITLFLVGQNGPLSFVFKDRINNKYKTSIGDSLNCSCSPNRNDHCIHTIYILLKVFKMSPQNPLIWQAAYVDSQLTDLLSGKHTISQPRRLVRPVFDPNEESDLPSRFLLDRKPMFIPKEAQCERMKLNQDSVCPICQEEMKEDMLLSYCKVKCGNNFHLECLKVWAQHKSSTQALITCPMCRSPFGQNYLRQIVEQQKQFSKKEQKKTMFKCGGCGVDPIPTNPHKCLLCTTFELCQCCYSAKKHIKHPFIRRNRQGRWHGAQERRQAELKMKNYIDNRRKETTNQKLLSKLRKVQQDPNKLLDFVATSYPYVSKYISDNIDPHKKLGFSSQDMQCMKCGSKKMIFLRRLNCGHFIDHECLKQQIRLGKFHCQKDGQKFTKGFENLQIRQRSIEQPINYSSIKKEFDPRSMQTNTNSHGFTEQQRQAPTLTQVLGNYEREDSLGEERIRQRFLSSVVTRQNPVEINENPTTARIRQRSRPPLENNQIRIRNVSRSSRRERDESEKVPARNKRVSRQDMERILQSMIGRKVF